MRKIMIMLVFALSTLAVSAAVSVDPPPDCYPNCFVGR